MVKHRSASILSIVSVIALFTALAAAQSDTSAELQTIRVRLDADTVAHFVLNEDGSGEYVRADDAPHWPQVSRWNVLGWLFFLGLIGQAMFMGRFALQWFVSERAGKSVVPLGFWWLSLAGATILLIYFIIRQDAIGILGQALGWPIYMRNIYMVLRDRKSGALNPTDPARHPVPDPNAEA